MSDARSIPDAPIDLVDLFGPLASMHAALERVGLARPCAITACYPSRRIEEIARAVAARPRFPVLSRTLVWDRSRPLLIGDGRSVALLDTDAPILSPSQARNDASWQVRLRQDGPDVRLDAIFSHAIADGLSMLAFATAVAEGLGTASPAAPTRNVGLPTSQQPFAAWLPRFVLDQHRRYRRLATSPDATPGASWCRLSHDEGERLLDRAASCGIGFSGYLAAAALRALRDQQGWRSGNTLLNVPIARPLPATANGFGFGIGSLILPVRLDELNDVTAAAARISTRLRRMAATGWDRNLERLLGRNPRRHLAFARIQQRRPDPMVTVSWKGRQPLGDARDVACFAVSPAAHVSAHIDEDGLSISLTTPQPVEERHAVLAGLVAALGCSIAGSIRDLA